jgi:hypothetical protein
LKSTDTETLITIKNLLPRCYLPEKKHGKNVVNFEMLSKLFLQVAQEEKQGEEPKSISTLKRFVTIINHFDEKPLSWNYLVDFFSQSISPCPLKVNEIDFADFWKLKDNYIVQMYVSILNNFNVFYLLLFPDFHNVVKIKLKDVQLFRKWYPYFQNVRI